MIKTEVLNRKVYIPETRDKILSRSDLTTLSARIAEYITDKINPSMYDYSYVKHKIIDKIIDNLSPEVVTKEGKITKRLQKLMRQEGFKIYYDEWFKTEGNNYISSILSHINASSDTICDITSSLNWDSGDFGDANSCYWKTTGCHGRNYIRLSMNDDCHHKAIREYSIERDSNNNIVPNHGTGRGWLYDINDDLSSLLLYNTYGTLNNDVSSTAKKCQLLLNSLTGLSYNIYNYPHNKVKYDTDIYINGTSIYLITREDTLPENVKIKLKITHDYEAHNTFVCEACDYEYNEDELMHYGGSQYCYDCYCEFITTCECCGEDILREDAVYVESYGDICDNCHSDYFNTCAECEELYHENNLTYIDGLGYYCNDCLTEWTIKCDVCGEYHLKSDTTELIEFGKIVYNLCPDCKERSFICDKCEYLFTYNDNSLTIDDKNLCLSCYLNTILKSDCVL